MSSAFRLLSRRLLCLGAILVMAPVVRAQELPKALFVPEDASPAMKAALTVGSILSTAAGVQIIKSPTAWPRTWEGFGARVADQTGFYVTKTATFRAVAQVLDYRQDVAPFAPEALIGCAITATFTAFDASGRRRVNAPLVTSVVVGTGASLLWRPERHDAGTAWAFAGTRLGVSFGGYVAQRILMDWWTQRGR